MVGAKAMVDPHNSLTASDAIDFVCREEFDYTCKEIAEGKPFPRSRA
jgi:magnesium-protoporphyrin IX monomethyl ester (oxidative) cyclase